jgi:exodeoxyribonuclease V beta subunit
MKSQQAAVLDPITFPLHGARLIEASAGTGKTFTICSLYLRLLLGHGGADSRHPYPLTVDQILVVTFTEAATEELRSRIRSRIRDARLAFMRGHSYDFFLKQLLVDEPNHDLASQLLLQAERQMDEAAVYTIHGFCQRMLVNSAFESGSLFETSFLTDESKLRNQVVADYWRKKFYSLSPELSSIIRERWKTPSALLSEINPYLSGAPIFIKGNELKGSIESIHEENLDLINNLKKSWIEASGDIQRAFDESDVNRRSYTKKSLPNWIEQLNYWAKEETSTYYTPDCLTKFSASVLAEKSKVSPPTHSVFDEIQTFFETPPSVVDSIMKDAVEECRTLLQNAKDKIHVLAFDDLLTQLSNALKSESGNVLAARIREMFPVAMIDEFQDTDPLQYSIFSRIYRTRLAQKVEIKESGIFMIGDPKQAIYAFRGADIFTYIRARREVTSHFTLSTNWRSTSRMISSVNALFNNCDKPFIFDEDIKFHNALHSANSTTNHWSIEGVVQPAMTIWNNEETTPVAKKDYMNVMTDSCVEQIKTLLANPTAEICSGDDKRRIKAGDIAILVRTSNEARAIRKALSKNEIASVYLSNRDSVFSTTEAHDILRILTAMNEPTENHSLKPALATHLLGSTADTLVSIETNEHLLEEVVLEFSNYQYIWDKKGVLPALRQLVLNRGIAERLLSTIDGERKIADFFHVAELLQEESQSTNSRHGLIRWLTEKIEEPNGNAEEQQVRLESENELVKIVTIHKSKGLEYDFVFMPYISNYRESGSSLYHDEETSKTILDTKKSHYALNLAEKERLAEDLRLLYVAVTRAVYGCFMGVAPLRNGRSTKDPSGLHKSGIGWIVQNGETLAAAQLEEALEKLSKSCDEIAITTPLKQGQCAYELDFSSEVETVTAQANKRQINENWYVTSFSALTANAHSSHSHQKELFANTDEIEDEDKSEQLTIFNFHKGAKAGTFLHTVFENIDYNEPNSEKNAEIINELLLLEGYEAEWCPVIQKLASDTLTKPISSDSVVLGSLDKDQILCEMEFVFPINKLKASAVSRLCAEHDPMSANLSELNFFDVSGMLKGFIDLTFECNGKFYVLDWKSNHLGDSHDHYTQDAIKTAMRDHRYDLQYQIYSLALHKYLQSRVPDYSYEEHFGGAIYLFLRGINAENDNGIFYSKPSEDFLNQFDYLMAGK